MTDFIDTLLTSMSSKFNETNADLQINLNEDKTLKWRGLHNNQYAAVKKRNKDIKRSSEKATTAATATDNDPPLKSDSVSSSSSNSNSTAVNNKTTGVNADDVASTAIADVTQPIENSSSSNNNNNRSSDSIAIVVIEEDSVQSDRNNLSSADKMETTTTTTTNNDKEKETDDVDQQQQRPFRRTLRRKQNAAGVAGAGGGDETTRSTDDVSALSDKNRKIVLRPKRHSSAGSASEHRSVSPRGSSVASEKDEIPSGGAANRNIVTRQRGRAKKSHDRENSVESQSNESMPPKTRAERKNSISHEIDDANSHHQPTPPKLRRSERMHTSTPNNDHIGPDDRNSNKSDLLDTIVLVADQKTSDREHGTRSRKRTFDDKKPNECVEIKDEKIINSMPIEIDCVEIKDECEVVEVKDEQPTTAAAAAEKSEPDTKDVTKDHAQKMEDVEIIESDTIAVAAAAAAASAETSAHNDDQLSNGSDGGAAAAVAVVVGASATVAAKSTSSAAARKRGRGRPNLNKKGNLKLNMTIATRNSPVKKSPRFSSDETPFVYTIPKKDKIAAEQSQPHQRLSRRIKPTPKILANEELRQGFELQNNARLSNSNEHLDNELDRSPKQKTPPSTPPSSSSSSSSSAAVAAAAAAAAAALASTSVPLAISQNSNVKLPPNIPTASASTSAAAATAHQSSDTVRNGGSVDAAANRRRKSNTPPKRQSSNSNDAPQYEVIRPPVRRPCPDPEKFLHEIKLAKINLHRSPELNAKLNVKQKKRLIKLKERHFQKLGLQRVSKVHRSGGGGAAGSSSENEIESDDNEDFVPTQKISNVGRPSVTLRMRGQKDIVIYNKHITKATKPTIRTDKPTTITKKPPPAIAISHSTTAHASANTPSLPSAIIDQLDRHSKELITRNPEISLISSTKHKAGSSAAGTSAARSRLQPKSSSSAHDNHHLHQHHHQITSEVTLSIRKEAIDSNVCLCNKVSKFYTRKTDETYCSAVDQIEDQKVGCGNEVEGELLNLLRPSVRVSYMLLCESHKKRLVSHNCCASCGVFLTQGTFMLCAKNHFFHRDCATKFILNAPFDPQNPEFTCPTLVLKCPHCNADAPERETIVTMRCGSVPIFTTSQKKLTKPAKMSIGPHSYRAIKSRDELHLLEIEHLIPENVLALLTRAQNRFPFTRQGSPHSNKDVFTAVTKDDVDRMAEIIASGYDISTPIKEFYNGTCLHLVSNFGSIRMAQLILSRVAATDFFNLLDQNLRTAIMCAICGNKNDILKLLVQCGADVTIKGTEGMTALHLAVKLKNYEALEIILNTYRESSTLCQVEKFLNTRDDGGWTAIVWGADIGNAKIVSALLNCGADPRICDDENNSALHWATLSGNVETVTVLLQAGCNLTAQNINGDTPLHIACRNDNTRIALYLLAHGASLDITNNTDESPYDCIRDENGACGRAIMFNLQIRNITGLPERNIIHQDISNGREMYPIQVVIRKKYRNARAASSQSDSDNDQLIPDFKYITKTILLQNSIQIDRRVSQMRICSCADNCTTQSCQCSEISIQNWYSSDGRLISDFKYHDPAMIFECNDVCGCNKLLCKNRVVQKGSKVAMQIFECNERAKGFGVRGIAKIPRGTFISEYTGEILTDNEADRRTDDTYFFDLSSSGFCIDANFYGNVSRFFNHSCEPNAVPIRVYYEHQDIRFPKIAFFATKDIEPGDEITFDYGEKFWIAKHKLFTCHCGTKSCRFSEATIAKTLEEYNRRNA